MGKPGFFSDSFDLFVVFLSGVALAYVSNFVTPVHMQTQMMVSGLLAFVLACLGPEFDEILEWVFFFTLGIFIANLSPEIKSYYYKGTYSLPTIFVICKWTLPYCLKLLAPWFIAMPPGIIFAKLTNRLTNRSYYRHARFF